MKHITERILEIDPIKLVPNSGLKGETYLLSPEEFKSVQSHLGLISSYVDTVKCSNVILVKETPESVLRMIDSLLNLGYDPDITLAKLENLMKKRISSDNLGI